MKQKQIIATVRYPPTQRSNFQPRVGRDSTESAPNPGHLSRIRQLTFKNPRGELADIYSTTRIWQRFHGIRAKSMLKFPRASWQISRCPSPQDLAEIPRNPRQNFDPASGPTKFWQISGPIGQISANFFFLPTPGKKFGRFSAGFR